GGEDHGRIHALDVAGPRALGAERLDAVRDRQEIARAGDPAPLDQTPVHRDVEERGAAAHVGLEDEAMAALEEPAERALPPFDPAQQLQIALHPLGRLEPERFRVTLPALLQL